MIIDEKKVVAKSKSYSKGFKGIIPTAERGKKGDKMYAMRMAVGIAIAVAFASGVLALIYTLISEGNTAVQRITDEQNAPKQYIEVIYKPSKK